MIDRKVIGQRPLLTLPQIIAVLALVAALFIGLDLNRRAQAGREIGGSERALGADVAAEETRQVELRSTLEYVNSEAYVEQYAREEAGLIQPGERRVVPLLLDTTPIPTAAPTPTPDPAYDARPWQAWWRLLTDAPLPAP